jgi:hypothetical protein
LIGRLCPPSINAVNCRICDYNFGFPSEEKVWKTTLTIYSQFVWDALCRRTSRPERLKLSEIEQSSYSVMLNIAESLPSNFRNSVRRFPTDSQVFLLIPELSLISANSTDPNSKQFPESRELHQNKVEENFGNRVQCRFGHIREIPYRHCFGRW